MSSGPEKKILILFDVLFTFLGNSYLFTFLIPAYTAKESYLQVLEPSKSKSLIVSSILVPGVVSIFHSQVT